MALAWTPAVIDTRIWLDASDAGTLIRSSSGSVSAWLDKSGNDNHVVQNTSNSLCPSLVTNAINGLPGVNFDGGDWLAISSVNNLTVETANTFLVVNKPTAGGVGFQRIISSSTNSAADYLNNGIYHISPTTNNGKDAGGPHLLASAWVGIAKDLRNFYVARLNISSPVINYLGIIGEIIITSNLNTDDFQRVEGYLAHKWSLTSALAAEHPYKTAEPTYGQPLTGNVTKATGGPADIVLIRDWTTKMHITEVEPDANGDWSADVPPGQYDITYLADGCAPICHGPYTVTEP